MLVCYFIGYDIFEDEYSILIDNPRFVKFRELYKDRYDEVAGIADNKFNILKYNLIHRIRNENNLGYEEILFPYSILVFWANHRFVSYLPKEVIIYNKDKIKCFATMTRNIELSFIIEILDILPWSAHALSCRRDIHDDSMTIHLLNNNKRIYDDGEIFYTITHIKNNNLKLNLLCEDILRRIDKNHSEYKRCYKELYLLSINDTIIGNKYDLIKIYDRFELYFITKLDRKYLPNSSSY